MAKIRIRNSSKVTLNGKKPGQEFSIDVDGDGVPLDRYWRSRFDEKAVEMGYLTILTGDTKAPEPVAPAKSDPGSKSSSAASPQTATSKK